MLRRRFLPALVVVALAGACGGDDDSLATADFIAQADEICAATEEASDALGEPDDLEDLAELLPAQQELFEEMRDDLRALDTPEDPEVRDDLLTRLDVVLGDLEDLAAAVEEDEAAAISVATEAGEHSDETEEILSAHGFTECGIDEDDDELDEELADEGDGPTDLGDETGDFDIDDYPVQYDPSDEDVDALAAILAPEFGGMLTDDEVSCVARFILERASLLELDDVNAEGLGEAAALECLSLDRLFEIGQEVG